MPYDTKLKWENYGIGVPEPDDQHQNIFIYLFTVSLLAISLPFFNKIELSWKVNVSCPKPCPFQKL